MSKAARQLVALLVVPQRGATLDGAAWTRILTVARGEALAGTLAERCADVPMPPSVARQLADLRHDHRVQRNAALWEAEMARRALATVDVRFVLLKGTAYAAMGSSAATGRQIGDLDILVGRDDLDRTEQAVRAHGWEPLKTSSYDDAYYRRWMHELPPLIHRDRDRIIDIHHTILPPTGRLAPDAGRLLRDAQSANAATGDQSFLVLSPAARFCHSAAHLFADGDLQGGLRNLWDMDRLYRESSAADADFARVLATEAAAHGLTAAVARALRLARALFDTPTQSGAPVLSDRLYIARILARDGWGRETRKSLRLAFYLRSHWLRMPPLMLLRHLWTKWRAGRSAGETRRR